MRYEYGSAVQEADGTIWDEDFCMDLPATREAVAEWNREHAIGNDSGSVVVAVRRLIPETEIYEPGGSDS